MRDPAVLRIGCVKYLNARPLVYGWEGEVKFDAPSALCAQLARGEIDIALVSSVEYLRNPVYRVVDGVSISSDGPVYSVMVAYKGQKPLPIIEMDPASRTSVFLLRHLIADRGETFREVEMSADSLSALANGHARMLIGDQAIRFRQKFSGEYQYWDLGEEWKGLTGLPFVYALWLIRPEVKDAQLIAEKLRELRDRNLSNLDDLIARETDFGREFCHHYYRENVRFTFGAKEKEGLLKFATECVALGLIPKHDLDLKLV